MKTLIASWILCLLFAGCERSAPPRWQTGWIQGGDVPDLVAAEELPLFAPEDAKVMELVRVEGAWQVFLDGESQGEARDEEALYERLRDGKETANLAGLRPELLISAGSQVPCRVVWRAMGIGLMVGIDRFNFLVVDHGARTALPLSLPIVVGSFVPPEIEPKVLRVDSGGHFFTGSGPSQVPMADFAALEENVAAFAAAVKAASSEPIVRIHLDRDAAYQDFIDLMAVCYRQEVRVINLLEMVDPTDEEGAGSEAGIHVKPRAPGQ